MNRSAAFEILQKHNQTHLLKYYDQLTEDRQRQLLEDIKRIDFTPLENINEHKERILGEITPIDVLDLDRINSSRADFEKTGIEILKQGKVGAVLLAGGQGSRLGFDKPKGTFDMGLTRPLSIFAQQMNNIAEVRAKTGVFFHIFVMTSASNNADTRQFFKDNNFFGYDPEKIHFYVQDVAPACDFNGKIFLEEKHRVAFTPNGNGGWYSSLINNGLGEVLKSEGIEWLNVYSVDNVLQRICDPVFVGAAALKDVNCAAKVVKKNDPDEKVGVLCNENGKPMVIEYYEMPKDLKNLRKNGELVHCYGVILNYLFKVSALNGIISGKLPYHLAKKAIPHIENGVKVNPANPCGYKFETLVVDMVKLSQNCLGFEVEREREFAPVKNQTGTDSVESARALLIKNGVKL